MHIRKDSVISAMIEIKEMKHPNKKDKVRIQAFLKDMDWMFGLQNYDRSFTFEKENKENWAARIDVQEDYQRIQIFIYPSFFDVSLQKQREYLLHEFCHYLTDSIAVVAWKLSCGELVPDKLRKESVEKSTSMICNILDKLLTGKMTFVKKSYEDYLK